MAMQRIGDSLREDLEAAAREQGVDYFGIADLTPAHGFIEAQGGKIVASFPRAISIGIRLFDALVDMVEPNSRFETSPYVHHIYRVVTPRLDVISLNLAHMLRGRGHEALPVPHGMSGRNTSILSYKLPAHLAGLGWIGKNCLLITPECGPRVRFSAVLTHAPLGAGEPLKERCGDCMACVAACPVKAFTGRAFHPDEPRDTRFEAAKCEIYRGNDRTAGEPQVKGPRTMYACGMCVRACPYGDPKQKEPKSQS